MPDFDSYDFVVIGGGAAGYFGAISYAERVLGDRILILEKTGSVLGKVKISGGGRCNVTHACFDPRQLTGYYPRGGKNLIGAFHRWGPAETVDWFESRGVALKTESDGRMFPTTDQSQTVMDCLTGEARHMGVELATKTEVTELSWENERWRIRLGDGDVISARAVLLATGGIRNAAGADIAEALGHEVVAASPSLFTFKIADPRLEDLAGLSVANVEARVEGPGLKTDGPCLVTHWGLSGPAILKLSAWGARELAECQYRFEVIINWCAGKKEADLLEVIRVAREEAPKKRVKSGVREIEIPLRLWQRLVAAAGIDDEVMWTNLSNAQRHALIQNLSASRFQVEGKSMNKEEFVTAGGVALNQVNFKTMESKLTPGLYFAGEVLDVDGVTGGFNFQAAWTTGRIAGESAAAL